MHLLFNSFSEETDLVDYHDNTFPFYTTFYILLGATIIYWIFGKIALQLTFKGIFGKKKDHKKSGYDWRNLMSLYIL